MEQHVIGVVGAGVMGTGVAQNLAQTGHRVLLLDLTEEILRKAEGVIRQNVRLQRMVQRDQVHLSVATVMEQILFTTDAARFAEADFVVENVSERWEAKREVYRQLDAVCPQHTVFAANTSAISITRIAAVTRRPARVLGIHFMNPVPLKQTVEVIRGFHTSDEAIAVAQRVLTAMNKRWVLVNDYPGFVSNRISHVFMNEAACVVQDQVASARDVDEIFKKCYGHTMGPLQTADLIGLDTVVDTLHVLYESYQDARFRCCPLLQKMVDAGLLGVKSGQGFYTYESGASGC